MKIRNGFVSNSSSASFVVYWRCNEAVNKDVDIGGLISGSHLEDIKKCTESTASNGVYKTHGFTSMYNDENDIPAKLAYLVLALTIHRGKYELIDFNIENDGD